MVPASAGTPGTIGVLEALRHCGGSRHVRHTEAERSSSAPPGGKRTSFGTAGFRGKR